MGHGDQEGHAVVAERGAPLAWRGVDCVRDVVGVAEGGDLRRGKGRDGRVLAGGRWGEQARREGGRPRLGVGVHCEEYELGFKNCILFLFFIF